jgi:N-ethylmaleimide reductase
MKTVENNYSINALRKNKSSVEHACRISNSSQVKAAGQMWTDLKAYKIFSTKEMTEQDILHAKTEYVAAAENALFAGFDGVELHGANGYLLEESFACKQYPYGSIGSIENRCRFVLDVVAVAQAIENRHSFIALQ